MITQKKTDLSFFQGAANPEIATKYGLPRDVRFCKRCVISNQRPSSTVEYNHKNDSKKQTINFDSEGVCDACRVAEMKKKIDWVERERQLIELCDKHRSKDGSFDCIVPGSGGKDSFYASHMLKYKYGMHPLTVTWAPHMYTDWGWRNFQAWIHAGFDNVLITPNGRVHRLLTRLALENIYHPFQPFFFGQKSVAPKLAIDRNIQLVFYGENEAEYGNAIESYETAKQSYDYFMAADQSKIHLSGVSLQDLKSEFGLNASDLDLYTPADPQKIKDGKVEVHYMGYYLKWHPQSCYYYSVENGGFQSSPERTPGTYSKYSSIDDKIDDFHYYTTFVKFGIGRATYDASQEIRSGDINRDEGVALVKKFDGEFPERFLQELYAYLSMDSKTFSSVAELFEHPLMNHEYFTNLTDSARSHHLWMHDHGVWKLRHTVWQ